MLPAAVLSALSVMMLLMVSAHNVGIKVKRSSKQSLNGLVRLTGDASVQLNVSGLQSSAGTAADSAADQDIDLQCGENTGQCSVSAAVGVYYLRGEDFAVLNIIKLKLLGMTEVLKNFSVFISNCDSHYMNSFFTDFLTVLMLKAAVAASEGTSAVANMEVTAFYKQRSAFHQHFCQLFAGIRIDLLYSCAGNRHLLSAFLLGEPFFVNQADCLIFIDGEGDRKHVGCFRTGGKA